MHARGILILHLYLSIYHVSQVVKHAAWGLKLTDIKAHGYVIVPKVMFLSGVLDYFDRNKISSGGDLSHYSSASLY